MVMQAIGAAPWQAAENRLTSQTASCRPHSTATNVQTQGGPITVAVALPHPLGLGRLRADFSQM